MSMPSYHKGASGHRVPPLDLGRQWRDPVFTSISLVFVGIFAALVIQGIWGHSSSPVVSLFAADVSDSSINSVFFSAGEICRQQRLFLLPGDLQIDIWFADQPSLIRRQYVERNHQQPDCNLPPSEEELEIHGLGQNPGTSLVKVVQLLHLEAYKLHSLPSGLPIIVVIALHEIEPGLGEENSFSNLVEVLQDLAEVTDAIWLLGPKGELARELNRLSFEVEGVRFCSSRDSRDIELCLEQAFERE